VSGNGSGNDITAANILEQIKTAIKPQDHDLKQFKVQTRTNQKV
jgi:hypothetical protein